MTFEEYQKKALETALYLEDERNKVIYPSLGLAGEAGEVANKVKKVLRDKNWDFSSEIRNEVEGELGDVLWYVAQVATDLNLSLENIVKRNIEKLASRKERGVLGGDGDRR